MAKIVQKLTWFVEENDSLDIFLEENIENDLSSNPTFKNLYQTIKYKLKLLNAIDKEKTVTLEDQQKLINNLNTQIKNLEQTVNSLNLKLTEAEVVETSYH